MVSAQLISPGSAVGALVATSVVLVVGIVISGFMPGLAFLGLALWIIMLAGLATGVFLIARGGRALAGAGVLVLVASIGLEFYVNVSLPPFVWVGLFFLGVGLIAWGTRDDVPLKSSWPVGLAQLVVERLQALMVGRLAQRGLGQHDGHNVQGQHEREIVWELGQAIGPGVRADVQRVRGPHRQAQQEAGWSFEQEQRATDWQQVDQHWSDRRPVGADDQEADDELGRIRADGT